MVLSDKVHTIIKVYSIGWISPKMPGTRSVSDFGIYAVYLPVEHPRSKNPELEIFQIAFPVGTQQVLDFLAFQIRDTQPVLYYQH